MLNPIIDILNRRLAVRAISPQPLTPEIIDDLIEAVRLTPSCMNKQPWNYVFAVSAGARKKFADIFTGGNLKWAPKAPLIIVGYARKQDDCVIPDGRAYYQFDLGMSAMNLMLAATHHGLTARPMAGFDPQKVRDILEMAPEYEPSIAIAVGFPSDDESDIPDSYKGIGNKPRVRKQKGEIVKII